MVLEIKSPMENGACACLWVRFSKWIPNKGRNRSHHKPGSQRKIGGQTRTSMNLKGPLVQHRHTKNSATNIDDILSHTQILAVVAEANYHCHNLLG